jgi:hypothetical protein
MPFLLSLRLSVFLNRPVDSTSGAPVTVVRCVERSPAIAARVKLLVLCCVPSNRSSSSMLPSPAASPAKTGVAEPLPAPAADPALCLALLLLMEMSAPASAAAAAAAAAFGEPGGEHAGLMWMWRRSM